MAKGIEGIGLKVSETLAISMKPRCKSSRVRVSLPDIWGIPAYHPEHTFSRVCYLHLEARHCRSCHENSYRGRSSLGNLQLVNSVASYWVERHQQYPTAHPCDESTQHSPSLDLVLSNSGIVFVQFLRSV